MPPHTSAPSEHTKVMRSCEGGPPGWQGLPPVYLNSRPSTKSEMTLKLLSTSPSERGSALSLYQQAAVPKGHLLRLSSVVRLTGPQREMTRLESPGRRCISTLVFVPASMRRSYWSSPAVHSILFGRQANLGKERGGGYQGQFTSSGHLAVILTGEAVSGRLGGWTCDLKQVY